MMKRTLASLAAAVAVLLLLVAGINLYVIRSTAPSTYTPETLGSAPKFPDAVLILGAGLSRDGQASGILRDRLDVALKALKQYPDAKALVTGDHGRVNHDEVNTMRRYLEQHGIASERIFMDHAGFNTYDSMYRARDIFRVERPLIVTQGFHMSRSIFLARSMGMDAAGVTADLHLYGGEARFSAREVPARFKDFVQATLLKPQPRYLGAAIPIRTCSGLDTHDGK